MHEDEDVEIEIAADDESVGEQAMGKVKKLREDLAACRRDKQEYMDGWQRAKADYVNALKRFDTEKKAERTRGVVKAAEALLPALDALERSREHGEIPAGFAAIAKQLTSAFSSLGLESFGEKGERFDPALHEALGQDETDVCEIDETVSAVLEKGWRMGETLVRPAKVRVWRCESAT